MATDSFGRKSAYYVGMSDNNFGTLLKNRREASTDPSTGRPYTQVRLASIVRDLTEEKISRALLSGWELGASQPSVKHVNALSKVAGLMLPVMDSAIALGLELDQVQLSQQERDLLAEFRRLSDSPPLQEAAVRVVHALRTPRKVSS